MWKASIPSRGGNPNMAPLETNMAHMDMNMAPMKTPGTPGWPQDSVPVEVFDQIIRHLQHSDLRNMRLVCREFREKTSANFVHTLAAQFRPEFCLPPLDSSGSSWKQGLSLLKQYGHHIRRFTMCLEVDEDELSGIPLKLDQKLVQSFWGIYLWPEDGYSRCPDLVRLEAAADNTRGIKMAIQPLANVTDMAISCDPGWGRLLGPDRHHIVAKVGDHHQAMGLPMIRGRSPSQHTRLPEEPKPFAENAAQRKHSTLTKMLLDAEFAEGDLDSVMEFEKFKAVSAGRKPVLSLEDSEPGLIPAKLRRSQKDFLGELEFASRAFVQSWAMAISEPGCFRHLTCLRLAKIPSSHLHIFDNFNFWSGLPTVNEVHLQVLANWRKLSRERDAMAFTNEAVEPVEATADAYRLLRFISGLKNITTLHFEWLCGGELSWGSQQGRYVLPLPFTSRPEYMTSESPMTSEFLTSESLSPTHTLSFPHITSLSLKNCWCNPRVFLDLMRGMARSLVDLKLESVSLSGPATPNNTGVSFPLLWRLERIARSYRLASNVSLHLPDIQWQVPLDPVPALPQVPALGPDTDDTDDTDVLFIGPVPALGTDTNVPALPHVPALGADTDALFIGPVPVNQPPPPSPFLTWPRIIKFLSAGSNIPGSSRIERMEFKSCGYVAVENLAIDSSHLITWDALASHYNWASWEIYLEAHRAGPMMQSSWSEFNGWIVPRFPDEEAEALTDMGMQMGWEGVYDSRTIQLAKAVNPREPGQGRFSGVVSWDRWGGRAV